VEGGRMKVVISQPMKGKTREQIMEERKRALEVAKIKGDEVIETVYEDYKDEGNIPIKCLARSIEAIGDADAVIFMNGYSAARECSVEYLVCAEYGIRAIFEEEYCVLPN
jgi:predicted RNase H-like HicB family nuclease